MPCKVLSLGLFTQSC